MAAKARKEFTLLTIPVAQPVERLSTIIALEVNETDARALARGLVPPHVRQQCQSAIEWCEQDERGYIKGSIPKGRRRR